MSKLDEIQGLIGPELQRLNQIIADTLQSSSELTNHIVSDYLRTKGKQIRPILVLLSARLFGGINDAVLQGGASIELLHNASLIHDDVIDQSQSRRGAATINSVWDNHVAVLVGDFFVSCSLVCAEKTHNPRVLTSLARMGAELALGEIDQIDNARGREITEEAYHKIIRHKTASLFTSCMEVGGITSGGDDERIARLMQYAMLLGECFQMRDDIFDYFDDAAGIGKPTGNDLLEGKISLPLIYALNRTDMPEQAQMKQLVRKEQLTSQDVARLVDYARRAGGIDYTYRQMEQMRVEAFKLLDCFEPSETLDALKGIFSYIITRNK